VITEFYLRACFGGTFFIYHENVALLLVMHSLVTLERKPPLGPYVAFKNADK
jgi:hypothetical protein